MKNTKKIRKNSLILFAIFSLALILLNCSHDPTGIAEIKKVCFSSDILPIFQTNCAKSGCHDSKGKGGYNFENYASIMKSITPNDAKASEAYKVITATFINPMPPSQPLSLEQRQLIEIWIQQGSDSSKCQ